MKAFIDLTKCTGNGVCADLCPSVFEIDEFGFGAVIGGGIVPADDEEAACDAEDSCPEGAIRLMESDS